jgi:hypothetical protein
MTDLENLRLLVEHLGTAGTKHDRAIIVIGETIRLGIGTGPAIIVTLNELGFNKQHVGILLHEETGSDPQRHHWWRDGNGRYHCHDVT